MNADRPALLLFDADALKDEALYRRCYAEATPQRRQKADAYRRAEDRRLSLAAAMLLKRALPDAGPVLADARGKLYSPDGMQFNLSHAGRWAALAVGPLPVGVDIERRRTEARGVAQRFFCPEETALLEAQTDPEKRNALFFRLWTLKESFLKATGLGLELPLNAFCISFENGEPRVKHAVNGRDYRFREYFCVDGYALSVCAENAGEYPALPAVVGPC